MESKTNKNTKRKIDQCVRQFREFLTESPRRETRDIGEIPAKELNALIGEFLIDLKKKTDGSDYKPDSLTSFHRGIVRYLQTVGYEYNIVKSSVFHTSKKMLEMRRRELKQSGKGNRQNRAEPLSAEQEDRLWLTGQLGTDSAETVQNTLWYFVTNLRAFRGSHEARQLQWGDLKLCEDENTEFLEFTERETKTRTGNSDLRPLPLKCFLILLSPLSVPSKCTNFIVPTGPKTCHTKTHRFS